MANSNPAQSYDDFLETFDVSGHAPFVHATTEQYLDDDLALKRFIDTAARDDTTLEREPYRQGPKKVSPEEADLKRLDFFAKNQKQCCEELRERFLEGRISDAQIDAYMYAFAHLWVDGYTRRLESDEMRAIIASVAQHDLQFNPNQARLYVENSTIKDVEPLFTPEQMAVVFSANENMLHTTIENYFTYLADPLERSVNRTYVRRGMYRIKPPGEIWREAHHLNSYSLTLSVVEQFSQTYRPSTAGKGVPTIISTPLPNIQQRVVAFAGFINDMPLEQMELVVAPPLRAYRTKATGGHGTNHEIQEYLYD